MTDPTLSPERRAEIKDQCDYARTGPVQDYWTRCYRDHVADLLAAHDALAAEVATLRQLAERAEGLLEDALCVMDCSSGDDRDSDNWLSQTKHRIRAALNAAKEGK